MTRNLNLDALRSFATLMIVVHHVPRQGVISLFDWTVPVFFALSGYLMFVNYSPDSYARKLKNRISRLVVPFFVWNVIFVSCFLLTKWLMPGLATGADGGHVQNGVWIIGKAFGFAYEPGDPPLWYLRTLVGLTLISPLVYVILKRRLGLFACLVFGGFWWCAEVYFGFVPICMLSYRRTHLLHLLSEDGLL